MAVIDRALPETREAFDGVAAEYDRSNAANRLLRGMRDRARQAVFRFVTPGSNLLDLGCGPGCDDEHFARLGYRVTAVDWSPAMIRETRRRVAAAGLGHRVAVYTMGIHEIDRLARAQFDAVYSNFGPLNCVADLATAAALIADRLKPGGVVVASVIGRVCPWEIALYLARGDWRRATIRFRRDFVPVALKGRTVWTRYYTPAEFERTFAALGLRRIALRALGVFVPPPYLHAFADRRPATVAALERVDDFVGAWPLVRQWGDHFLITLRKSDVARG